MNDIFLSYARQDIEVAKRLANALAGEKWSVWWDRKILAGTTWREVLEAALENSRCIVVLWSSSSVASHFVIEEADFGRTRGVLCPVLIEAVEQPLGFRSIQTADLSDWKGDLSASSFRSLVDAVARLIQPGTSATEIAPSHPREMLQKSMTEPLTGKWRVECDIPGGAAAWYELELHQNTELSGTGGVYFDRGPLKQIRSSMGRAGQELATTFSQPFAIAGAWSYDEPHETLSLDVKASAFGQTQRDLLQIRLTATSGGIKGEDAEGRSYRFSRMR